MKGIITGLVLLALFIPSAQAFNLVDRCVNATNTVAQYEIINSETNEIVVSQESPVECQYGCNNVSGTCNPLPQTLTYYHGIGLTLLVLVMYIAFVIIKTNPKEGEGI